MIIPVSPKNGNIIFDVHQPFVNYMLEDIFNLPFKYLLPKKYKWFPFPQEITMHMQMLQHLSGQHPN